MKVKAFRKRKESDVAEVYDDIITAPLPKANLSCCAIINYSVKSLPTILIASTYYFIGHIIPQNSHN